jgi:guanine deaminase
MVAGKWVVRDRHVLNVNLAKLRRDAEAAVARLTEANAEARALAERLHPFVGQFCAGLC